MAKNETTTTAPMVRLSAPLPPQRQRSQGFLDKANDLQFAIEQLATLASVDRPTIGREIAYAGLVAVGEASGLVLDWNETDKRYEFYTAPAPDAQAQG